MKAPESSADQPRSKSNPDKNKLHEQEDSSARPSTTDSYANSSERDEVLEVKRASKMENQMIQVWRAVVTVVLLFVATAVTFTTYRFLEDAEEDTFLTAFDQFSRTVGDSARNHQKTVRQTYRSLANDLEADANRQGATWPFYTMEYFENRGNNALILSGTEALTLITIVYDDILDEWLNYTDTTHEQWVKEAHMLRSGNLDRLINEENYISAITTVCRDCPGGNKPAEIVRDYYLVCWSYTPAPFSYGLINLDLRIVDDYEQITKAAIDLKDEVLVTRVRPYSAAEGLAFTREEHEAMHSKLEGSLIEHPHAFVWIPVHAKLQDRESEVVSFIIVGMALDTALINLLPEGIYVTAVIKNNCNQVHTYEIIGKEAIYVGEGDFHETEYSDQEVEVNLFEGLYTNPEYETRSGHCQYTMHIYPNAALRATYKEDTPAIFAGVVAFTFVLVAVVFFVYDVFVTRRNNKMVRTAAHSNAVVSSLFPGKYRDQMIGNIMSGGRPGSSSVSKRGGVPLADLYLECTVLFADVAGFTAWSSVREPHQVFTLLETLYSAFDKIARRRRIFKVETVGDCYVAASGVPEPREDHATAICRFARDILAKTIQVTNELIVTLGPDTGDLSIRMGIHSGPVTGGVLRGERARFQLFGDTVNTCSRLESTGRAGKIQISAATRELLATSGRGNWVELRDDKVVAKGKGELETFWLRTGGMSNGKPGSVSGKSESLQSEADNALFLNEKSVLHKYWSSRESTASELISSDSGFDERTSRLIDWNTEVLVRLLQVVVASRDVNAGKNGDKTASTSEKTDRETKSSFLDEVAEIIHLPEFDQTSAKNHQHPESVELPVQAVHQLRDYVATIASMYRDNAFHNFEHASHVMMSVNKLMSRIVAPSNLETLDELDTETGEGDTKEPLAEESIHEVQKRKAALAANLHDHTYGITSDPLTQFACAISALIHDVDHQGVTNAQLVNENALVAQMYQNRTVAEQNSLELAWNLLMEESYADLRKTIFTTDDERSRFRQLIVNSVMATDIADKDLKNLRNGRWDKAFRLVEGGEAFNESKRDAVNRKATIVIEHLIQASDVSHTMQHWHIYRRWNENLFRETYAAFRHGRCEKDPSLNWYKGEMAFFDLYLIPLAQKLKECGVFGKSSGEFLNYARENRREWEIRGEEVIAEMMKKELDSSSDSQRQHRRYSGADTNVFFDEELKC